MHILIYIDPGSGSYLVQVIAAAALGIAFFFRNIKAWFIHFFSKLTRKNRR